MSSRKKNQINWKRPKYSEREWMNDRERERDTALFSYIGGKTEKRNTTITATNDIANEWRNLKYKKL